VTCFSKLTVCVLAAIAMTASVATPCAAQQVTMLDEELKPFLESQDIPGVAAAVLRGDRLVAFGAAGVTVEGTDESVSFTNRWHIGSCTKAMTATMIGQLIDSKFLDWDTTVIDVMPDLKGKIDPACENITVHQLLTHTAGLPAYRNPTLEEQKLLSSLTGTPREQRRQFVEKLLASPPLTTPGSAFDYSNAGYGVVASMAEEKMDNSWERLMYMRMWAAIGMTTAGTGWPRIEARPREPMGHWRRDGKPVPMGMDSSYQLSPAIAPAGDVYCTISDLARFAGIHLNGLQGQNALWISSQTIKALHEPVLDDYACGWKKLEVDGRQVEWHNGSAGTFFTWMTIDVQHDTVVVVAINCGDSEEACRAITVQLLDEFAPMPKSAKPTQEP